MVLQLDSLQSPPLLSQPCPWQLLSLSQAQKTFRRPEIQAEIRTFFSSQNPQFYATGIEKLVVRYGKCLNNLGDYVEK